MSSELPDTEKPSIVVDILVSLWILFIAVMYYGGYLSPRIGLLTGAASSVYGVVLILAVVAAGRRYLAVRPNPSTQGAAQPVDPKKR